MVVDNQGDFHRAVWLEPFPSRQATQVDLRSAANFSAYLRQVCTWSAVEIIAEVETGLLNVGNHLPRRSSYLAPAYQIE